MMAIASRMGTHDVWFDETLAEIAQALRRSDYLWVVDAQVWDLYKDKLMGEGLNPILIPVHEGRKNLDSAQALCKELVQRGVKRSTTLGVIGGGILQDLAGFSASILFRGIPWIFIPTTLLAQGDSCIGGKTSLNFIDAKNLLGTFWPPKEVRICPSFVSTLTAEDYFSGLGEILKLHILAGKDDLSSFEAAMPSLHKREPRAVLKATIRSLEIKKGYIEQDEFDGGIRQVLNYGHCFGHALESASHYRIPHGQAVVAGMLMSNVVANERGVLSEETFQKQRAILLSNLIIPPRLEELELSPILSAIAKDKKRLGKGFALIMVRDNGPSFQVQDLREEEVIRAIALTTFSKSLFRPPPRLDSE